MSKNILLNSRLNFIFVLGIIFLLPLTPVSAEVVWTEDWETGPFDEWLIQAYSYHGDQAELPGFQPNSSFEPTFTNGVLKTTDPTPSEDWDGWSGVARNSTTAYGTWSFDWVIESGVDHESYVNIFFITNNYEDDLTNLTIAEAKMTGYMLNLQSGNSGPHPANTINIGILESRTPDTPGQTTMYYHSSPLVGTYHIDVTRSLDGWFNVFLNEDDPANPDPPIIRVIDNHTTTSGRFVCGAWSGDSVLDNITVSNTVDIMYTPPSTTTTTTTDETPTSGFEYTIILSSFVCLLTIYRKRRTR